MGNLKTLVIVLALALLVPCFQSTAHAKSSWTGTQVLTIAAADNVEISGKVAARASAHVFMVPSKGTNTFFGYAGPRFNLSDRFWTSPQIGIVGNWTPDGGDAFLTSLWNGITLMNGDVFLFLEGDAYFYDSTADYYGYYSADYNIGRVGLGLQGEQVNTDLIAGPHVTLNTKVGPFISVQYYVAVKSEFAHTVRFQTGLFF